MVRSAAPPALDYALSLRRNGQTRAAYGAFQQVRNLAPDLPAALAGQAEAALLLGAPLMAAELARAAGPSARVTRASALVRQGALDAARLEIAQLATDPEQAGTVAVLQLLLAIAEGDYETALFELSGIAQDPGNANVARELFLHGFRAFAECGDAKRFTAFLDGIGLAERPLCPPHEEVTEPIDIIIPVHNAPNDVADCLSAIRRNPDPRQGRLILVDDGSDAPAATLLQEAAKAADVLLIRLEGNVGFTRAVMAGLEQSKSSYAVLLNSDAIITPGWLSAMADTMSSAPQVALVGPLSDNGYFQTVAERPEPIPERYPDTPEARRSVAMVNAFTRRKRPQMPMLSGFCLLIRREAVDAVGGLDAELFPHGYWEVQDLALRLLDAGYCHRVADDAFVFHLGGRSLPSARKTALMADGMSRMFHRHSALRVMAAECLCALQPDVLALKTQIRTEMQPDLSRPVFEPPSRWIVPLPSVAGEQVCLFMAHAPWGAVSALTEAYIAALRAGGLRVVLCLAVENVSGSVSSTLRDLADAVMVRGNVGYDFAAWADALRTEPQLWQASRLWFVNDSVAGPLAPLQPVLNSIRGRNAGFFALSECTDFGHHAQSFFFGWNAANLSCTALRDFWANVEILEDKAQIVLKYEFNLLHLSKLLTDPSTQIVFNMRDIFGLAPAQLTGINPTHHGWQVLCDAGFPFIKTDLLRDGRRGLSTRDWREVCRALGTDPAVVERHVELSRLFRGKGGI